MIRLSAIAALLALALPARALDAGEALEAPSPRSVTAVASPDRVHLGETFTLTLEVRDRSDVRYELPAALSLGKEIDVVTIATHRSADGTDTITRFDIQASLFDLGEKSIPDVVLSATGPHGTGSLTVPGPKVTGIGSIRDEGKAELHDILPPVEVLVPRYTALWVIGGTLLAVFAAWMLWRTLSGRPTKVPSVHQPPRPPAHERALADLDALQREGLPAQGREKEHFFRLSEILRDYLGERFDFLALDMTTPELLDMLARTPTPGLDYRLFELWCQNGDLVKYAKLPASPAMCKAAIEEAFSFVRATMPQGLSSQQGKAKTGAGA